MPLLRGDRHMTWFESSPPIDCLPYEDRIREILTLIVILRAAAESQTSSRNGARLRWLADGLERWLRDGNDLARVLGIQTPPGKRSAQKIQQIAARDRALLKFSEAVGSDLPPDLVRHRHRVQG